MDDKIEYPLPEKGDQLFIPGRDWWHNACLNYLPDDWELYAIGYKQAADVLVEYIKACQSHQDSLVFPIVFLYRQYLELRLKQLIKDGNHLLDRAEDFEDTHDLEKLWGDCKSVLEGIEPKPEKKELDAIDNLISQFCKVDPGFFSFRYSVTKKDQKTKERARSLPTDLKHINLRNLKEVMSKISNFLDGASDMISVYSEHKSEMEEYYQP